MMLLLHRGTERCVSCVSFHRTAPPPVHHHPAPLALFHSTFGDCDSRRAPNTRPCVGGRMWVVGVGCWAVLGRSIPCHVFCKSGNSRTLPPMLGESFRLRSCPLGCCSALPLILLVQRRHRTVGGIHRT